MTKGNLTGDYSPYKLVINIMYHLQGYILHRSTAMFYSRVLGAAELTQAAEQPYTRILQINYMDQSLGALRRGYIQSENKFEQKLSIV